MSVVQNRHLRSGLGPATPGFRRRLQCLWFKTDISGVFGEPLPKGTRVNLQCLWFKTDISGAVGAKPISLTLYTAFRESLGRQAFRDVIAFGLAEAK